MKTVALLGSHASLGLNTIWSCSTIWSHHSYLENDFPLSRTPGVFMKRLRGNFLETLCPLCLSRIPETPSTTSWFALFISSYSWNFLLQSTAYLSKSSTRVLYCSTLRCAQQHILVRMLLLTASTVAHSASLSLPPTISSELPSYRHAFLQI